MESNLQERDKNCKYCGLAYRQGGLEGLNCSECLQLVHVNCLRRGAVPGGLMGDVFFHFICQDCSKAGSELFIRDKMPWLQAILLVVYHMQLRNSALTKKGYLHWKLHIATFIDKNWDVLFRRDFKRKKKWTGTVSGTLSHYSPLFFKSGTSIFNEQGWWTLTYPTLSPSTIVKLNAELMVEKQKMKELKIPTDDIQLLHNILQGKSYATEEILKVTLFNIQNSGNNHSGNNMNGVTNHVRLVVRVPKPPENKKRKAPLLPTIDSLGRPKKVVKTTEPFYKKNSNATSKILNNCIVTKPQIKPNTADHMNHKAKEMVNGNHQLQVKPHPVVNGSVNGHVSIQEVTKPPKYLDPLCHYNTCLKDATQVSSQKLQARLTGGIRKDFIISPYTAIYLKPYIRRDVTINPPWLQLMDELQARVNRDNPNWRLPPRDPVDFTYVQPEHIPAINSLCNQFFWTGIDLADTLEYPDFSCVVLYRKLIVGFAFLVPDVKIHESYLSFIFTRPGWRRTGIAKFMLYHLIQTNFGKDITLHVSFSNPALFLYQKFGFKVEYVVLDFYNKYLPEDLRESKHAFFCRLER